jgi:uracil-DNA glycosylase family 4
MRRWAGPEWRPVPAARADGFKPFGALIGECPASEEVAKLQPFVGQSGQELNLAIKASGVPPRTNWIIDNVLACRAPKDTYDLIRIRLRREKATKLSPDHELHPSVHCRPRLLRTLRRTPNLVPMGKTAASAVLGEVTSILALRGRPIEGTDTIGGVSGPVRILPTLHPAFVRRSRRWRQVLAADLRRAARFFTNSLDWIEPHMILRPTLAQIGEFFSASSPLWSYDLETDALDTAVAQIRCMAITRKATPVEQARSGSPDTTLGLPLWSMDMGTYFYDVASLQYIAGMLQKVWTDGRLWTGWNCTYTGTPVVVDGKSVPIEKVVRGKMKGTTLGLDDRGNVVPAQITGWFRKRVKGQKWVVVRRVGEKKNARGLTVTPDHEVYTQRGRVRADRLVPGDLFLSKERLLDREEEQALRGTLQGDSCATCHTTRRGGRAVLVPIRHTTTASLRGSHADPVLVHEKNLWLDGLFLEHEEEPGGFHSESNTHVFRTPQLRQIALLAQDSYYANGSRRATREGLDKLGPVGWAWWFADDGNRRKRQGTRRESVELAVCRYSVRDQRVIRSWLKKHFGHVHLTRRGVLVFSVVAAEAFCLYISPYLLPAARYKLAATAHVSGFVGFPPGRQYRPYGVVVEAVTPWVPPTGTKYHRELAETRWCIQTTTGNFLTGFGFIKNSGYYDKAVVQRVLQVVPRPHVDGILLHRLTASELPHSLGVAASIYLDVTNWKQDNEGEKLAGTRDDAALLTYCCKDAAVTYRLYNILTKEVIVRGQAEPCPARPSITLPQLDHRIQDVCLGMHRTGLHIDQAKRKAFEEEVTAEVAQRRTTVNNLASSAGWKGEFNPASWQQVSRLLYDMIGLVPVDYTAAGDPSTDDDCLREHLMDPGVLGLPRALIIAQRAFRKKHKILTSFVHPMRTVEEGGLVGRDDRLHPNWSAHRTVSGRLASSDPNCFDGETEVLTLRDGWRFLSDLINKDEMNHDVAQWGEDGSVEFVRPTAWIKQHFKGDLIHLRRQRDIDMLVTPDHRCVVETRQGRRDVVTAENYPPDYKQLHGGVYAGGSRVMDPAFLRLVCAVQADAHATKHKYGWAVTFRLAKSRKIERLRAIFADLDDRLDVKEHWEEGRGQWYIRARGSAVDAVMDLLTPTKCFGPWLLHLPVDLLDTFCVEVFYWDGCFTRMNHYSSEWKVNAVWVQTILALRGHRANLRVYTAHGGAPNWQVDVLWNKPYSWTTNVEKIRVHHDGPVYCLSVPSSFVLIRRNGRIQVTGQCQNQPKVMRKLIVPAPGHVLVGADADQLEFRIAAARWKIQKYLEAFAAGLDPHQITMLMAFGELIWTYEGAPPRDHRFKKKWPGGSISGAFNRQRDLGKRFQYGGQYGANDKTKWGLIREAEDEHGNLVYAKLELAAVQEMSARYFAQCPELKLGWATEEALVKQNGYGQEPITGRRRDFLDGPERNEITNHPIQGSAAGIINLATLDVVEEFPEAYAGPGTGLIQQGHDALVLEVLEKDAERARDVLQSAMSPNYRHILDVAFTSEASIGRTWYEVC